ncbi:MAG: PLP-dependent aminotransferase family protein [Alphaproteobacteria bacterium]|nr:PLP-dependent aminotransferase family protein [Alphaproteobacteria bacterium]
MPWETSLVLPDGDQPAWLRLADAVVAEVRRGRLRPGDALPGTRRVAEQLGLHRNTVLRAWSELAGQGWITASQGGATRIAELPERPRPVGTPARGVPFALEVPPDEPPPWPTGTLTLAGGRPELRHLPTAELARAWRGAVRRTRGQILAYGDPEGHPRLREALRRMLATERGLVAEAPLVTRGAQQALYLLAHALFRPGDKVAVEAYGYPPAWAAFRSAGAELLGVEVDDQGLVTEHLEILARQGLRALYCTPHHQYPTMVTLPAARRLEVLRLASRYGFAIIEDDYDNEFHFRGRPVHPLASLDRSGTVAYVGTLSKVLAPGLRVGFLAAAPPVLRAVARLRRIVDRQGDTATESALAELIDDGTVPRHLRRMRRLYATRQARFASALHERLGDVLSWTLPAGGLSLWVESRVDVEQWSRTAASLGLGFETASRFRLDHEARPYFRAGFAALDDEEVRTALERLCTARPDALR